MLKIQRITTRMVSLPVARPFRIYYGDPVTSLGYVLVQAYSNEGHTGYGYAFLYWKLPILRTAIDELKDVALGRDPFEVRNIWRDMVTATTQFGPGGLAHVAISAIDVALWDLLAKVVGEPLYVLLGGGRDRVPCYYPGFWRSTPASELGAEAEEARQQGFRAVKMKLGGEASLEKEIERVKAVRAAIGDDISLMVDANQGWSADFAIKIGERLKDYNIYWMEDPVPHDDLQGSARVAASLDIPVSTGEGAYTRAELAQMVDHGAGDIYNLDSQRLGGVTGWLRAASFLEARDLRFTAHLFPEIQCHLIASAEKGLTVEHMPWSFALFKEPPKVIDGFIQLPQAPGIGLELDEEAIKRYEVR
ncbi:MAG: mandelate racemase/muconate lactonizing enzyme family protein [Chloroflexi bacterium]|nr:mandelate racemase/muconate lactonizing enzyme family protein [Chloroflexota bacterium]